MRYTKDYSQFPEHIAKVEAMKDVQDFLGKADLRRVIKILQGDYLSTMRGLHIGLALIGIEGYPAKVMIDLYAPKQLKLF